jgi:hypothetical protein
MDSKQTNSTPMTIGIITPLFATTKNPTPFRISPFFSTPEEKKRKRKEPKNPTPLHRNLSVLLKILSQHQKKRTAKKNTHAHNNAIIEVEKKDQSKNKIK